VKPGRLLGIDIGTSGIKCTLVTLDGTLVADASSEVRTDRRSPGWAEQHPHVWIDAVGAALVELSRAPGGLSDVLSVGVTAATHSAVLLDRKYRPVRPAIMWTDRRSHRQAQSLEHEHRALIMHLGLNRPTPTWTLPQLRWLADHEPAVLEATHHLVFVKDYIRWWLTGELATDPIDASGSLMLDVLHRTWAPALTSLVPLDEALLPSLIEPSAIAGAVTSAAAETTGLPAGIPVACGTSDTAAEALAVGVTKAGAGVVKLATAGTISLFGTRPYPDDRSLTYRHVPDGLWYSCHATSSAAASLRWLRDTLSAAGQPTDFTGLDALAARVPAGSDGAVFLPFLEGERSPHWDPDLRASFSGLQSSHGLAHLARAVMEGVACSLRDCLDAAELLTGRPEFLRLAGGGGRSKVWPGILATVLGRPLEKTEHTDAAFGAAMIAGVTAGQFQTVAEAVDMCVRVTGVVEPCAPDLERYSTLLDSYRRTTRALAPVYHQSSSGPISESM
jgi:xylulokinase